MLLGSYHSYSFHSYQANHGTETKQFKYGVERRRLREKRARIVVCGFLLPVDPWAPNIDSQSIASQLFAVSLFPYLGFLYFMTKSKSAPKLTLFGFYFLLAFVGATSEFLSRFLSLVKCVFGTLLSVNMNKVAIIPLLFSGKV